MLNIILIAIMLIVLSLGIFFFPMVLGLSCWFSMFLLGISIMYLFQDIVFKANSILLGIGDLLLKISYFSLTFAICFVQQKSFLSYVFYGAVVVVGLFDIFVLRVKRKDIFLDGENKKTAVSKPNQTNSQKANVNNIMDEYEKIEKLKNTVKTKVTIDGKEQEMTYNEIIKKLYSFKPGNGRILLRLIEDDPKTGKQRECNLSGVRRFLERHAKNGDTLSKNMLEEMDALNMENSQFIIKNLFIRDEKKQNYYLVLVEKNKKMNLKELNQHILVFLHNYHYIY